MNFSRRDFLGTLTMGAAATALPGCLCPCARSVNAKIALQLYSIREYIGGKRLPSKPGQPTGGVWDGSGVGLERALADVAAMGYTGVEFAGYYNNNAKQLRKMLADAGLVACGTHVSRDSFSPDKVKATCEFNLGFGNNLLICPGGGNFPGKDENLDDFLKMLVDYYNRAAVNAAKYGCKIGLHNHQREFQLKMSDGTSYWDYFFRNTAENVCMEQDVGWTTAAGHDPCEQYELYPHRSPTLHAKENGYGSKKFDGILGEPGVQADGTVVPGVDWDALIPATEKDGVEWYVVECEAHANELTASLASYDFLRTKGLK